MLSWSVMLLSLAASLPRTVVSAWSLATLLSGLSLAVLLEPLVSSVNPTESREGQRNTRRLPRGMGCV